MPYETGLRHAEESQLFPVPARSVTDLARRVRPKDEHPASAPPLFAGDLVQSAPLDVQQPVRLEPLAADELHDDVVAVVGEQLDLQIGRVQPVERDDGRGGDVVAAVELPGTEELLLDHDFARLL